MQVYQFHQNYKEKACPDFIKSGSGQ